MKRFAWITGAVLLLAVLGYLAAYLLGEVPIHIRTNGNVLKHRNTIVEDPRDLQGVLARKQLATAETRVLNLTWHYGTDVERRFHTTGEGTPGDEVLEGEIAGDRLSYNSRYYFYYKAGQVIVCRDTFPLPFPADRRNVDLFDTAAPHTPTAMDHREAWELGIGNTGYVVIAATTTTPSDPRPKKRLYRISIAEIEEKLP